MPHVIDVLAAGSWVLVHYPTTRFHLYTGLGVLIRATQAALLGHLGGALFADRPLLGLAMGCTGALAISGLVVIESGRRPNRQSWS